jgi:hypothetical protein
MQAAVSRDMEVPPQYEGKIILVIGTRSGEHVYDAEIKGSLLK